MRHHPLTILFRIFQLVRNSFFFVLFLFILRRDSDFWLFTYGRYAFLIYAGLRIIYIFASWFKETYSWENESSFIIKKGLFVTQTSTIPFNKIQNVTERVSFLHKLFGVSSLTFETAMSGEDNHVTFEVVSKKQAAKLKSLIDISKKQMEALPDGELIGETQIQEGVSDEEHPVKAQRMETMQERVVHFIPTKKDLWKASFTSLSFLAIIPVLGSLLDNLEPILPDFESLDLPFSQLLNQPLIIIALIAIAVLVAIAFGVVRTFVRYGNYEISSSDTHIFIHRGILDESYFLIEKKKVQGFEIKQSPIKRLLKLAEVKLIHSSGLQRSEDPVRVNSLYPFLPVDKAYRLVEQLMPSYTIEQNMIRLPKVSLCIKLLRPSWFWIIATAALYYFKPRIFGIEQLWWILSALLLIIVVLDRVLDYRHTKYCITGDQLQWQHGGLMSQLFVTKRVKVIEVEVSQTRLQKKFKLFTVKTKNRSAPIRVDGINDVPRSFMSSFNDWYKQRTAETKIDNGNS